MTHPEKKLSTESDNYTVDLYSGKLHINEVSDPSKIESLLSFASRYNDKRQYMFASNVLGKYIPAKPSSIERAQNALIEDLSLLNEPTTVVGFAESACGLGESMFDKINQRNNTLNNQSAYIHTTRQYLPSDNVLIEFKEPHSHAADQVLLKPASKDVEDIMKKSTCLVVVEDEITTGKTLLNFLREYFKVHQNIKRLIILTYVDWRTTKQRLALSMDFPALDIQTCSLLSGVIDFDVKRVNKPYSKPDNMSAKTRPNYSNEGAKFGKKWAPNCIDKALVKVKEITNGLKEPMIIAGTSEFTFWSQQLATAIENEGGDVRVLATTRAPLQIGNDIHSKLIFESHYGDGEAHFIYNIQSDRKVIICYETQEQASFHAPFLNSLNAFGLVKDK